MRSAVIVVAIVLISEPAFADQPTNGHPTLAEQAQRAMRATIGDASTNPSMARKQGTPKKWTKRKGAIVGGSIGGGVGAVAATASAQTTGLSISIRHADEAQQAPDSDVVGSPRLDHISARTGQGPKTLSDTPGVVSSTLIGAGLGAGIWFVAAVRAAEGGEPWAALLGAGIGGLSGFAGGGLVKATQVRHPVWQTILYTVAGGIVWTAAGAFVERAEESYRNAGVYLTIGVVHGAATGGFAIALTR